MGFLKNLFAKYREDDFLMEEDLWDEAYFYNRESAEEEEYAEIQRRTRLIRWHIVDIALYNLVASLHKHLN